jgi:hypothetical protein
MLVSALSGRCLDIHYLVYFGNVEKKQGRCVEQKNSDRDQNKPMFDVTLGNNHVKQRPSEKEIVRLQLVQLDVLDNATYTEKTTNRKSQRLCFRKALIRLGCLGSQKRRGQQERKVVSDEPHAKAIATIAVFPLKVIIGNNSRTI